MRNLIPTFILGLCLITFFSACKDSSDSKGETTQEQSEKKPVADQVKLIPIELNNGEKWKVDELTNLGVNDIKTALNEINVTASEEEYQILTSNLIGTIKQTYNSSKLEGGAKEQFTNFIDNIAQILDHLQSSDTFIRQDAVEELKKMLNTYSDYFE